MPLKDTAPRGLLDPFSFPPDPVVFLAADDHGDEEEIARSILAGLVNFDFFFFPRHDGFPSLIT